MAINSVTSVGAAANKTNQTPAKDSITFDGDAFMKLLMTQLKYQDPMNPMKDQEFMAQLAQMNTLSEIKKLNTNVEALSKAQAIAEGAALLGKEVEALSDGRMVQGVVNQVRVNGTDILVGVGNNTAKLADVQSVREVK